MGARVATLAVAVIVLAVGPALGATLGAALLVGLGAGTLLGYANALLGRPGGRLARLRVARANVWAMVSAFVCPVVLASASGSGLPWGLGLIPALGLLVIVALDLRAGPRLVRASGTSDKAGLPIGFWLAWAFLVSVIAVEFSIVFWGATLVQRQTGVTTEVATTLLGGLFLGGMFVGRLGQSLGLGTGGDIRRPAAIEHRARGDRFGDRVGLDRARRVWCGALRCRSWCRWPLSARRCRGPGRRARSPDPRRDAGDTCVGHRGS